MSKTTKPFPTQHSAAVDAERLAFKEKHSRFVAAFGAEHGSAYALAGLTLEQARAQYAETPEGKQAAQLTPAIGNGAAKFAAGLKLPK